jgi:hypothetical protein
VRQPALRGLPRALFFVLLRLAASFTHGPLNQLPTSADEFAPCLSPHIELVHRCTPRIENGDPSASRLSPRPGPQSDSAAGDASRCCAINPPSKQMRALGSPPPGAWSVDRGVCRDGARGACIGLERVFSTRVSHGDGPNLRGGSPLDADDKILSVDCPLTDATGFDVQLAKPVALGLGRRGWDRSVALSLVQPGGGSPVPCLLILRNPCLLSALPFSLCPTPFRRRAAHRVCRAVAVVRCTKIGALSRTWARRRTSSIAQRGVLHLQHCVWPPQQDTSTASLWVRATAARRGRHRPPGSQAYCVRLVVAQHKQCPVRRHPHHHIWGCPACPHPPLSIVYHRDVKYSRQLHPDLLSVCSRVP